MIIGAHALIYTPQAESVRAFFRDVLGFRSVDAGQGWLVFAMPPTEMGVHPDDGVGPKHEIYLMCDDVHATIAELETKGVEIARPVADQGWGLVTAIRLPGGMELGLYEPRHATALPNGAG
jgi:predicted enzyme related to lactoylglutathione lyase